MKKLGKILGSFNSALFDGLMRGLYELMVLSPVDFCTFTIVILYIFSST